MIHASGLEPRYQTGLSNGTQTTVADLPHSKGGEGCGFGAHELLEASLAACISITIRMHAEQRGFPLESVACSVQIGRDVPNVTALRYDISLEGPLTAEQREELRESARNCPVSKTLTGTIVVAPVK